MRSAYYIKTSLIIILFSVAQVAGFFPVPSAYAGPGSGDDFNPGEYVIEHVTDAYEWHITSIGDKHITLPLPVILYSRNKGLQLFLSSRFDHGHATWNGFAIAREGPHSGKIVEIDSHGHFIGKPFDLSITKVVAGLFVQALLIVILLVGIGFSARRSKLSAPRGLHNLIEPVVIFIRDEIAIPAIGNQKFERFMPFLLSLFFFILINNLLGLVPIFPFGVNITGNISVTLALALFTFFVTNISGNKHYWKEIFNPDVPWFMKLPVPIVPFVELSGVFIKPFVLMMRLFANIIAGHLIVTVFISLIFIFTSLLGPYAGWGVSPISVAFAVFITLLDVLVSFIQAYVFTLLSAIYFGMATAEHH